MKKALVLLLALLALSVPAFAQTQTYAPVPVAPHAQFFTNEGAPVASGFLCIYAAGTTTPATWYSDNAGTALPDPIRLNSAGIAQTGSSGAGVETGLYLSGLSYKVSLYASGTGNTCNGVPVGALIRTQDNVYDVGLIARQILITTYFAQPYAPTITFDTSAYSIFKVILTGNVTASTLANAQTGAIIQLTVCQDGTGSRTFVWPVTVLTPPIISSTASDCTEAMLYFDGTNWRGAGLNGTQSATGYKFTGTTTIANAAAASGSVVFSASTTSGAWTWTLPPDDGTPGQLLQTNGSGVTSWWGPTFPAPGGRLTTQTGVPISTTDRTAQATLFYTPYTNNQIWLYTASAWTYYAFPEESLSLTVTSGKNYDVFDYASGGVPTLELSAAWTNDTTRADALARQDGVWVKSSDHSRLWLGTIRASGANVTADSIGGSTTKVGGQGFICNYYNQVLRPLRVTDTTTAWAYGTDTIRQADASAGNKVEALFCDPGQTASAVVVASVDAQGSSGVGPSVGVGLDSTTTYSGGIGNLYTSAASQVLAQMTARYDGYPGIGYHYFSWNEAGDAGTVSEFRGSKTVGGVVFPVSSLTVLTPR